MRKIAIILLGCFVLAGCKRGNEMPPNEMPPPEPAEPAETRDFEYMDELMVQVETSRMNGNIEEAIGILDKALADKTCENFRPMLFSTQLGMLIEFDRADEACERFMKSIGTDDDLALSGFHIIYAHYDTQGDPAALMEWTDKLLQLDPPDDIARQIFARRMNDYIRNGSFDDFLETAARYINMTNEQACKNTFAGMTRYLISQERYADAESLLSIIEAQSGKTPILETFIMSSRVSLLCAEGRWDEAEKQFSQSVDSLPDADLRSCLRSAAGFAIKAGQTEMLDRLCDYVLKNQHDKDASRREAALQYIAAGKPKEDNEEILRRLNYLTQYDLPGKILLSLYHNHFYDIIQSGNPADIRNTLDFSKKLKSLFTEESDKKIIATTSLDLTFMLADYDSALKIIEQGIPSFDEQWHDMAINKIKAHIALRDGKKEEAIERFKKFMKHVSAWESPEYDPTMDILHTREMGLGFNWARIGDILASMGKDAEAKEAYDKARSYYEQALAETDEDKKEYAHIQTTLAKLTGPAKEKQKQATATPKQDIK